MKYTSNSIKVLKGMDAVRKRPGMYIGSTDINGLHQLIYEIVDNSVDEAMAGYGKAIHVTIHPDESVTVVDHGRGIPVGMHSSGKPTPEVVFTELHAGGKFNENVYKTSGGLHGVGASVVNALSTNLTVTINRGGHKYQEKFHNGGHPIGTLNDLGPTDDHTGTTVTFKPDDKIFDTVHINYRTIKDHLQQEAFLLHGIKIILDDDREPQHHEVFQYPKGIKEFVSKLNTGETTVGPIMFFKGEQHGITVKIAAQYTDSYSSNVLSFVNNVRTPEGGTQMIGLRTAWTHTFNQYGKEIGLIRSKKDSLTGSDVREGLTVVISLGVPEEMLQFEGQTKEKLGTSEARTVVNNIVNQQLEYYLMEHGKFAQKLIEKSSRAKDARNAARKARDAFRHNGKSKKKQKILISDKLSPAQSKDSSKKELFLVEGDSAGGSAKQGRDRKYQAILPLRGKVLNTERAPYSRVLKNEELSTIIYTIGAGVGKDFNIKKANYDKIIIFSDADSDGYHIQSLLLTFFYNYMRPMITHGHVYVALPPLFKVQNKHGKTKIAYAWTRPELDKKLKSFHKNYSVQRFKGLGEMDPDQLWYTSMDPKHRLLIRATIQDAQQAQLAEHQIALLMGRHVKPRRKWINSHIKFEMDDDNKVLKNNK